jgi:hypothetical protein
VSTLLLLRPNDFILRDMEALAARLGVDAQPLRDPGELDAASLDGVVGAVVSTAVTSAMPLSFAEVVGRLRRRAPRMPLAATTLARDGTSTAATIAADLAGIIPHVSLIVIDAGVLAHPALGSHEGVLVLRREDVVDPSARVPESLRRHFRL